MRKTFAALALVAAASLAGCTQIAQLQPVAGGQVTAVRIATNDVLVQKGVPIGVAPVCGVEGETYVCKGTTRGGRAIRSEATVIAPFGASKTQYGADSPADVSLKVTVGSKEIFNGKVENVLTKDAQEAR